MADDAKRYTVQVRLSERERKMLKELAANNDLSSSEVVRRMIVHHHGRQAGRS